MRKFTKQEKIDSRRQSVKCIKAEAKEFRDIVVKWLNDKGYKFTKALALTSYYGNVRIFNGQTITSMPIKRSRKLMAFKNPDGTYEGTPEAIAELKQRGGDGVYELAIHPKERKDYFCFFRIDWVNDIKDEFVLNSIKEFFSKSEGKIK